MSYPYYSPPPPPPPPSAPVCNTTAPPPSPPLPYVTPPLKGGAPPSSPSDGAPPPQGVYPPSPSKGTPSSPPMASPPKAYPPSPGNGTPSSPPTPTPKLPPSYLAPDPKYVHSPPIYGALPPSLPPSSNINAPPGGGGHHTAVIAACVSLGGLFMLAFLAVGLFCLAKRRKKLVMVPGPAPCAEVEEHEMIREPITTGPCGEQTVAVDIEDDVIIHSGAIGGAAAGTCHGGASGPPCEPSYPPGHHRPC